MEEKLIGCSSLSIYSRTTDELNMRITTRLKLDFHLSVFQWEREQERERARE